MVVSLLEDITVYDKKHIEIRFRFGDEIQAFLECFRSGEVGV